MTSSRPARRFDWYNLGLRAASAAVLIVAVVAVILLGNKTDLANAAFLIMLSLAVGVLALEWTRMSAPAASRPVAAAIIVAVLVSLYLPSMLHESWAWPAGWVGIVLGSAVTALIASRLNERSADAAFGVIYIAAPILALAWLHANDNPISWIILLFAVTWSADIFAFLVGNLLKGPKIWPRYSPNKTWAGFFGGLVGAVLSSLAVVWVTSHFSGANLSVGFAASVGLAGGLATMFGDLWESVLKRRYGVKDSGDLIPGHGGLLDRVDGLMIAILAVAGARLIHQIGWAQ
jgi:phosphatidate cytidylyltransferase